MVGTPLRVPLVDDLEGTPLHCTPTLFNDRSIRTTILFSIGIISKYLKDSGRRETGRMGRNAHRDIKRGHDEWQRRQRRRDCRWMFC